MPIEFNPPIASRSTEELLRIVGASEAWNEVAVDIARQELAARNVETNRINTARYLSKKRERIAIQRKANEGYHFCDFIFDPFLTFLEITFSWELRKDGFTRKADQQKYFRIILLAIIVICALVIYIAP